MPRSRHADRPHLSSKLVYSFNGNSAEGSRNKVELLGGKGANLAEMCHLGLPVPPGFTLTTEVCTAFHKLGGQYPKPLQSQVDEALLDLESSMNKKFGDPENPLLLSVRSGARVSMPGMMDTVLNLGLNEMTVAGLARKTSNERFAWDAYRRFIQMYSDVVLEIRGNEGDPLNPFAEALDRLKADRGVELDTELSAPDLQELVRTYKQIVLGATGIEFPSDPIEQLWGAIGAVFRSWNNERAIAYRSMNQIPGDWGTAVTVMSMVYGNMGETSGTGVAFTRDPSTGERRFYGE